MESCVYTLWGKWRCEHSATSSVHFVQVKLERIISGFQYVTSESYVRLLQKCLISSVSDRMGILVLQYACMDSLWNIYLADGNIDLVCVCVSKSKITFWE